MRELVSCGSLATDQLNLEAASLPDSSYAHRSHFSPSSLSSLHSSTLAALRSGFPGSAPAAVADSVASVLSCTQLFFGYFAAISKGSGNSHVNVTYFDSPTDAPMPREH